MRIVHVFVRSHFCPPFGFSFPPEVSPVEDVPRAVIFTSPFAIYRVGIFSSCSVFLCWWVEQALFRFEKCSALCNKRLRGRPQQRYGIRMCGTTGCSYEFVRYNWTLKTICVVQLDSLKQLWGTTGFTNIFVWYNWIL